MKKHAFSHQNNTLNNSHVMDNGEDMETVNDLSLVAQIDWTYLLSKIALVLAVLVTAFGGWH